MEYIRIFSKTNKPEKLHRKKVLEHLAAYLGIDHKKHKNRNLLSDAIRASLTYNTTDPVTLEDVRDIEDDDKIAWWQNDRRYVARLSSISSLMKSGNTINPWVTDVASGIQQSEDPEEYDRKYNMRHIKKITDTVVRASGAPPSDAEHAPIDVTEFFEFENTCEDLYTTHLTEILQNAHNMDGYTILLNGIDLTFHQYRAYNDTHSIQMLQIFCDNIDYSVRPLRYILDMFAFIQTVKPDNSMEIIRSVVIHMNDCVRI
tara:strand:- start:36 stop:812 length:777 start_codon:yes stop_codon:yes gene_type:complete